MPGQLTGPSDAPDPARVPSPSPRRVAYTEFEREDRIEVGDRDLYRVGIRGEERSTAVLLAEPADRAATGAGATRAFVAAAREWRTVDDHDHVAGVVDWGKKPRPWIATEGAPGGTLADRVGAVDPAFALWVGVCAAEALVYAHEEGITHRSLVPSAVRLRPVAGRWPVPRVADWGIGRWRREHVRSAPSADRKHYLAPEQLAPDRFGPPGTATDVYGLGVVLYELLTGELPHVTGVPADRAVLEAAPIPPSTVAPSLPPSLDDLLLASLSTDPSDRVGLAAFRRRLAAALRAEVGDPPDDRGRREEAADSSSLPSAFPLFDGDRAEWTADCPTCGASINNTAASFAAHWRDSSRCDGPPRDPPSRLADCTDDEWRRIVAGVEADAGGPGDRPRPTVDHPLFDALADDTRRVLAVGGVDVETPDGSFPWLTYPRRGWRVPCPACSASVFNAAAAMRAHWRDAADCDGPPDEFRTA